MQDARHPQRAGLLFFDLDDTIVVAGSHVSERVLQALGAAHDAGYVLSVASGRSLASIGTNILRRGVMDYAVCANGAAVVRLADGAMIAHRPMSQADALDCHEMLRPYDPAFNAFVGDKALFEWRGASYMLTGRTGGVARVRRYASASSGPVLRFVRLMWRGMRFGWRLLTNRQYKQVVSVLPHLRRAHGGVDKMGCTIVDAEACSRAALMLERDGRFEVMRMGATELEITARGVTKGTGAAALLRELGFAAQDAVAFGDGGNDLPIASAVGRFVAVGNADDEVKAAASDVCPSVTEDGVAVWLERNLLS